MRTRCSNCGAVLSEKSDECPRCKEKLNNKEYSRFPSDKVEKQISDHSERHDKIPYPYPPYPPSYDPRSYYSYPPYLYPPYPGYPPGYYYPPVQSIDAPRVLAAIPVLPSYFFLGIILIINLLLLFIGLGVVIPNLSMGVASIALIYPWPNFIFIINLSGLSLASWYLFIVVAIIISVIWLIKTEGREFYQIFIDSVKKFHPPPSKSDNSFVIITQFFIALVFFNVLIAIIMVLIGLPQSTPINGDQPPLWEYFFDLANASVAEEIFTRTVYIGLPLLAFDLIVRKRTEKLHRYFVGGGFKIEHITIFLIIMSSLFFGLAHYPGWGLWKVAPTFVAGLAFGYLYVRKGIHTAIILHFLFDYMALILLVFEGDIIVLSIISLILGLIMLFWVVSGSIYFSLYIYRIIDFFSQRLVPAKPQPTAAGYGLDKDMNLKKEQKYAPTRKAYTQEPVQPWPHPPPHYPYYWYPGYYYYPYIHQPLPEDRDEHVKEDDSTLLKIQYCPTCRNKLVYVPYYSRYYCEYCMNYVR